MDLRNAILLIAKRLNEEFGERIYAELLKKSIARALQSIVWDIFVNNLKEEQESKEIQQAVSVIREAAIKWDANIRIA